MTIGKVREQFGANADAYVSSEVHAKGPSLQRILELAGPDESWRVLDVATGAGHTAFALAPFVATVHATDITPQMLEHAGQQAAQRGLTNVKLEIADASDLPYAGNSFDLVTCRIAAHHFADVERFLTEAVRVLKPNGRVVVVDNVVPAGAVGDYVNELELLRDPSHVRCLSLEAWTSGFERVGLAVEKQETLTKQMDFDFWTQRHDHATKDYLRAMITEGNTAVRSFLEPQTNEGMLVFRLLEGLTIGRKAI